MPKIPFSSRRYGRYYFRRRVRLLDGKDIHVIVPLSTCDGQEARERVAILSAQFDRVRRTVNAYFEQNQTLDANTIKALFETELRDCLSKLSMELHDPSRDPAARVRDYRTMASALDIAQRPGTTNELTDAHRQMLAAHRCRHRSPPAAPCSAAADQSPIADRQAAIEALIVIARGCRDLRQPFGRETLQFSYSFARFVATEQVEPDC